MEKTSLKLGIVPLTDCAPIAVAREMGFFAAYGLDVEISREPSWANIRDKVAVGALDGAQMLSAMPIAASLGLGGLKTPMVTGFAMDLNGNAVTVSEALYQRMVDADPLAMSRRPVSAQALKVVIDEDKAAGRKPMTFATVFPFSPHNYELRYWMASAGIDPDRDVRLVVIPPPRMAEVLAAGDIDGYCVGEPWNEQAVVQGIGRTVITSYEIWNNRVEKVFGVTRAWAEAHPETHKAVIKALIQAAAWADRPENRMAVVELIAGPDYVDAPVEVVKMSMTGTFRYACGEAAQPLPDFNVFHRYAANFPWLSQAEWTITQMLRWGQLTLPLDVKATAAQAFRPDLYRAAAAELGVACPLVDHKIEGRNAGAWTLEAATRPIAMGADLFFDGRIFDPADPLRYLAGFEVKRLSLADA